MTWILYCRVSSFSHKIASDSLGCYAAPSMRSKRAHKLREICIAGTLQAPEPSQAVQPKAASEQAAISRDQMRTADRIIVSVLQKVRSPS